MQYLSAAQATTGCTFLPKQEEKHHGLQHVPSLDLWHRCFKLMSSLRDERPKAGETRAHHTCLRPTRSVPTPFLCLPAVFAYIVPEYDCAEVQRRSQELVASQ